MVSWVLLYLWLLLITTAGSDMVWSSDVSTSNKFITKNGESHEMIGCPFYLGWYDSNFNPHHMFVTYNAFELEEDGNTPLIFANLLGRPLFISGQ